MTVLNISAEVQYVSMIFIYVEEMLLLGYKSSVFSKKYTYNPDLFLYL